MTKEELRLIFEFLKRVQLTGAEAGTLVKIQQKIIEELKITK
jgi:hypothetical protein